MAGMPMRRPAAVAMSASPIPCASMVGRVGSDVSEVRNALIERTGLSQSFGLGDFPNLGKAGPRVPCEKIHSALNNAGDRFVVPV